MAADTQLTLRPRRFNLGDLMVGVWFGGRVHLSKTMLGLAKKIGLSNTLRTVERLLELWGFFLQVVDGMHLQHYSGSEKLIMCFLIAF